MEYGNLIKLEKKDKVGIVILDNPAKMNAISLEFLNELEAVEQEIERDSELLAIALVANGKNFCAGFNMDFLKTIDSEVVKTLLPRMQRVYSFWQNIHLPVIAGIQGYCLGSAVELALACDIRIIAEDTKIAILEAKYGLAPDMGGVTRMTKLIGIGQAKRMIMGCDEIDAREAKEIGLAEIVVPTEELREQTLKYAKKLTYMPPCSMRFAKKCIHVAQESSVAASLLCEEAQSVYCCGTQDKAEAVKAAMEKRRPVFIGK